MLPQFFAVTMLALLAGGCTTVGPVTLRHPGTGHTVRCEGYWYWNLDPREAQVQEQCQQRCIEEHERKGYRKIP